MFTCNELGLQSREGQEQGWSSRNALLPWCSLPVPSYLSDISTASSLVCPSNVVAPQTPSSALIYSLFTPVFLKVFRCQSIWQS